MSAPRVLLVSHAGVNVALLRRALVAHLLERGVEVHVAVPRDDFRDAVDALGAEVHPWKVARGSLNPLAARDAIRSLQEIVHETVPHLVHSFTHQPNVFSRLGTARPIPLVNSVTGLGSIFLGKGAKGAIRRSVFHFLYRATASRPQAVIFQNDDDRAHFERHKLLGDTAVRMVRGTGVDVRAIRPGAFEAGDVAAARAELGLGPEHVVLTLAARLIRDKGVFEFLDAARELAGRLPGARFLLVGDADPGNPSALSPDALAEATAGGAVVATGWRDDMPRIWALSDVAVLPSHREGLPVGLQEALASGLPVVTTDAPGCREIVSGGENGLLVPVGDAAALAEAMARLTHDADLRARMGAAGRARAEERFDAEKLAGEILAVYRELSEEFA